MALSNSQYNAVMRGYEERQRLQRRAMEARVREVYSKIPQIQELDRQLSSKGRRRVPDGCWAETQRAPGTSEGRTGGSERAETDAFKISRVPGRLYGASL